MVRSPATCSRRTSVACCCRSCTQATWWCWTTSAATGGQQCVRRLRAKAVGCCCYRPTARTSTRSRWPSPSSSGCCGRRQRGPWRRCGRPLANYWIASAPKSAVTTSNTLATTLHDLAERSNVRAIQYCSWIYVGRYKHIEEIKQESNRVAPFYFQLPDRARFAYEVKETDFEMGL